MRRVLAALSMITWMLSAAPASAQDKVQDKTQDKIRVVATFSILADLVRNVGGDAVDVTPLVGPNGDAHAYSPSPADAKRLAEAKLVLVNGLGFEGWIERLVKASGTKAAMVTVSKGVKPRQMADDGHDHGK